VTPFSRWERELPKLISDPRWSAVGSLKERRLMFDEFCRSVADEHKRGKSDRGRAARDGFAALLDEAAAAAGGVFTARHPFSAWHPLFRTFSREDERFRSLYVAWKHI
jgi:hypothetical protein